MIFLATFITLFLTALSILLMVTSILNFALGLLRSDADNVGIKVFLYALGAIVVWSVLYSLGAAVVA